MSKRTTFLDEPIKDVCHLRIVISDPDSNNCFLTVPIDSYISKFQDSSCIIQKGEHPFIKHISFANYKYAAVLSFQTIFNGIQTRKFIRKQDVSPELLKKIQDGAKISKNLNTPAILLSP